MAGRAISACLHAARPRRLSVFDRRALLRRRQVQIDRRARARSAHRRRRRRAHDLRHRDRADGAAAPLLHRSDGDGRRRHRSAQCAERHRAAALRARREDAALCRAPRRGDAGAHRHRRQGRRGRRPRDDAAAHQAQLDFDAAGVRLRAGRGEICHADAGRRSDRTQGDERQGGAESRTGDARRRRLCRAA